MPDPTPDACREAFERWRFRNVPTLSTDRLRYQRRYVESDVQREWNAFQAGAAWAAAHKEQGDDGK